uniref:Uncharacterized protein n=1 Tax=Onchocerca volvulus TaxID=6282 RepID=A0A8R1Y3T0_ONCVO
MTLAYPHYEKLIEMVLSDALSKLLENKITPIGSDYSYNGLLKSIGRFGNRNLIATYSLYSKATNKKPEDLLLFKKKRSFCGIIHFRRWNLTAK